MAYENVVLETEGPLAILKVNRPKALNALNSATLEEILSAARELDAAPQIKVVIVTGGGDKAFIAGADIVEMKDMTPTQAVAFSHRGHIALSALENMQKPVIAAVNGYALGGGFEVALACDIIYAAEKARLGFPEVTLGIFPGFGGTQRLPRLIGKGKAKELIYTGKMVTAQEAFEMGIVNRVFPQASLMEETKKVAAQIGGTGPIGVRLAKMIVDSGFNMDLGEACSMESYAFSLGFSTEDQKEGMKAFLEKRKYKYQGR